MPPTYHLQRGAAPLLVSMPHAGTALPNDMELYLSAAARRLPDTDWHVDRLYDFLADVGATVLTGRFSRYVIDLNRPPDDAELYPGQNTTGLCPVDTFDGQPLYLPGRSLESEEVATRVETYWRPYHRCLTEELRLLRLRFPRIVLWEAHTIRSELPRLFNGRLPDLNLGTNGRASCNRALADRLFEIARSATAYSAVLNGRFKGGYITRHYGHPETGVHAVQLEQTQVTYMNETYPFAFVEERASEIRPILRALVTEAIAWARS